MKSPFFILSVLIVSSCTYFLPSPDPAFDQYFSTDLVSQSGVSEEEYHNDLDTLQTLLNTSYGGWDYFQARGVDWLYRFSAAHGKVNDGVVKTMADFETLVWNLFDGVIDNHLSLSGYEYYHHNYHDDFMYTEIILQLQGQEYVVSDSGTTKVPLGAVYQGPSENLFPRYDGAEATWRLGHKGQEKDFLVVDFDGIPFKLLLNPPYERFFKGGRMVKKATSEKTIYLAVNSLNLSSDKVEAEADKLALDSFSQSGISSRGYETVVLDFRGNGGGDDSYWRKYLKDLYDLSSRDFLEGRSTTRYSEFVFQGMVRKYPFWALELKHRAESNQNQREEDPTMNLIPKRASLVPGPQGFTGRLILLVDRDSCSSGESIAAAVKAFPKAVVLGENTGGYVGFGNLVTYTLPRTGLRITFGPTYFEGAGGLYPFEGDGHGYDPDYWIATKTDLVSALRGLSGEDLGDLSPEFL